MGRRLLPAASLPRPSHLGWGGWSAPAIRGRGRGGVTPFGLRLGRVRLGFGHPLRSRRGLGRLHQEVPNLSHILSVLAHLGQHGFESFVEVPSQVGESLVEVGQVVCESLVEIMPLVGELLTDLLLLIGESLIGQIPLVGESLVEMLKLFGEPLIGQIPLVGESLTDLLLLIGESLIGQIPLVGESLVEMLKLFGEPLIGQIPLVGESLTDLLLLFGESLIGQIPLVGESLTDLLLLVGESLIGQIPLVGESLIGLPLLFGEAPVDPVQEKNPQGRNRAKKGHQGSPVPDEELSVAQRDIHRLRIERDFHFDFSWCRPAGGRAAMLLGGNRGRKPPSPELSGIRGILRIDKNVPFVRGQVAEAVRRKGGGQFPPLRTERRGRSRWASSPSTSRVEGAPSLCQGTRSRQAEGGGWSKPTPGAG